MRWDSVSLFNSFRDYKCVFTVCVCVCVCVCGQQLLWCGGRRILFKLLQEEPAGQRLSAGVQRCSSEVSVSPSAGSTQQQTEWLHSDIYMQQCWRPELMILPSKHLLSQKNNMQKDFCRGSIVAQLFKNLVVSMFFYSLFVLFLYWSTFWHLFLKCALSYLIIIIIIIIKWNLCLKTSYERTGFSYPL